LKARQYKLASIELEGEGKKALEALKVEKDPKKIAKLIEYIEKNVINDLEHLAFEGSQDHHLASAYDDTFVQFAGGHMRYYFICKAGATNWKCLSLLASKEWTQLFPDTAWCSGQRWYCRTCAARYRAGFGVIVEVRKGGHFYYMQAECPPDGVIDVRAMMHEEKYAKTKKLSAAELYALLPTTRPTPTSFVIEQGNGFMKFINEATLETLPEWKWETIFQFAKSMEDW
jgi:hypothetical protein